MAAQQKFVRYGSARNSKNHQDVVLDSLDCCNVILNTDLRGELPLMRELFAVKNVVYPSTSKTTYHAGGSARSNSWQKRFIKGLDGQNLEKGQACCGSRVHGTEGHLGSGVGARRYTLQPNGSHSEGQGRRGFGMEGDSQVDYGNQKGNVNSFRLKNSFLASENFLYDCTRNLHDDEFSLQHWMSFGCIESDTSLGEYWDDKIPTNAKKRSKARRIPSPSRDVFKVKNKDWRKSMHKRKYLTSSKNNNLSLQSHQNLSSLMLNSYDDDSFEHDHYLPSFILKGPVFVQQRQTNKVKMSEPHKKYNLFQDGSQVRAPFSRQHIPRFGIRKAGKETWRAKTKPTSLPSTGQRIPQDMGRSYSDDELVVSRLPGNRCNKCAPSMKVNKRSHRDWKAQFVQKAQNAKKAEATLLLTEPLASSKKKECFLVDRSERDPAGKLASDRLIAEKGLRNMNCEVQEGGLTSIPSEGEKIAVTVERIRSLSQKYRPKKLKDLIGQNLVARALSNALSKDKIAPVYLFQGAHGTGKTSAARIFAAALNCVTSGDKKPCGYCSACTALASSKTSGVWELDAASHNEIGYLKELIESTVSASSSPRYRILIIDECHMFSYETWSALLKLLEEPPGKVVFILITTDPEKLPLTVVSRCQKFHFLRIKHSDIVNRLDTVMKQENLVAEPGALNLIASKSEGSLRDAETVLDQASLLGQRITLATIHQLVGSVPDDKLLSLLDSTLSSDTVGTVQRTRGLIDSGVEPMDLISQLATLITDILSGSYVRMYTNQDVGCLSLHALSDLEMERLQVVLRILSEAERQLRAVHQYGTTWLIAALLQFRPSHPSQSEGLNSSRSPFASTATQPILKNAKANKQNAFRIGIEDRKRTVSMEMGCEQETQGSESVGTDKSTRSGFEAQVHPTYLSSLPRKPSVLSLRGRSPPFNKGINLHFKSLNNLGSLWVNVLKCCSPLSLRQLLECHGKLLAVSFSAAETVAHLLFEKPDHKLKAEMYRISIANSFRKVLGLSVEVKISLGQVLCKAGFTRSPAAESEGCEDEEPQGGRGILDVEPLQYLRAENELSVQLPLKDFNSTLCSPTLFALPVSSGTQPQLTIKSTMVSGGSTQPSCGAKAAMPEQHSSKSTPIHDSKSCAPMQISNCQAQNLRDSNKLPNESVNDRMWQRKTVWRPIAGLHATKYSCDGAFASLKDDNNIQVDNFEDKNLILEPQLKCGGLLCWKS